MQQGGCASPNKAVTRYQLGRAEVQCQRNAGVKSPQTKVRRPPGAGRPAHSACCVQTGPLCLPKAGAGHSPPRDAGSTAPGWRGGVAAVRSASPGSQGHSHEPLSETCVVFALRGLAGDSRHSPLLRHQARFAGSHHAAGRGDGDSVRAGMSHHVRRAAPLCCLTFLGAFHVISEPLT